MLVPHIKRAMNYIFHELIGKIVEMYIDDVVVKSKGYREHLADLRKALECTRRHGLQMIRINVPLMCQLVNSWVSWCMSEELKLVRKLYQLLTKLKPLQQKLNFSH